MEVTLAALKDVFVQQRNGTDYLFICQASTTHKLLSVLRTSYPHNYVKWISVHASFLATIIAGKFSKASFVHALIFLIIPCQKYSIIKIILEINILKVHVHSIMIRV